MANKRKYKTDPELLLAQGKAIVAVREEARYQHKVAMVNLVLSGLSPSFLAKYCGDCKNAISGWVKRADECGFEALRDGKSTGSPPSKWQRSTDCWEKKNLRCTATACGTGRACRICSRSATALPTA